MIDKDEKEHKASSDKRITCTLQYKFIIAQLNAETVFVSTYMFINKNGDQVRLLVTHGHDCFMGIIM